MKNKMNMKNAWKSMFKRSIFFTSLVPVASLVRFVLPCWLAARRVARGESREPCDAGDRLSWQDGQAPNVAFESYGDAADKAEAMGLISAEGRRRVHAAILRSGNKTSTAGTSPIGGRLRARGNTSRDSSAFSRAVRGVSVRCGW